MADRDIFAPPTPEERGLFAPPTPAELGQADSPLLGIIKAAARGQGYGPEEVAKYQAPSATGAIPPSVRPEFAGSADIMLSQLQQQTPEYKQALAAEEAKQQQFKKEHPVLDVAGEYGPLLYAGGSLAAKAVGKIPAAVKNVASSAVLGKGYPIVKSLFPAAEEAAAKVVTPLEHAAMTPTITKEALQVSAQAPYQQAEAITSELAQAHKKAGAVIDSGYKSAVTKLQGKPPAILNPTEFADSSTAAEYLAKNATQLPDGKLSLPAEKLPEMAKVLGKGTFKAPASATEAAIIAKNKEADALARSKIRTAAEKFDPSIKDDYAKMTEAYKHQKDISKAAKNPRKVNPDVSSKLDATYGSKVSKAVENAKEAADYEKRMFEHRGKAPEIQPDKPSSIEELLGILNPSTPSRVLGGKEFIRRRAGNIESILKKSPRKAASYDAEEEK